MDYSLATAPKKYLPLLKEKIKSKIPKLNERQLKRFQLSPSDAIADELTEMGCDKALEVFRKIIKYDRQQPAKFGKLEKNCGMLHKIFHHLKAADIDGHRTEEAEIEIILRIIEDFRNESSKFDWLIELLFAHASEVIEKNHLENTKIGVIVKFVHANVLEEKFKWYRPAVVLLESAFQISSAHEEWQFRNVQLCALVSQKLSICLTKLSTQIRTTEENFEGALLLSSKALKVLREFINESSIKIEIEAEIEYASCWFDKKSFEEALKHFGHAIALAEEIKNSKKVCEVLVKIAECYKRLNDFEKYENFLMIAKEKVSDELNDIDFEGEINLKLAKTFLEIHNHEKLVTHFNLAIQCFLKSKNVCKLNEVKLIFANHKAKLIFNQIIDSILVSDKLDIGANQELEKLLLWYDRKNPILNRHHAFYLNNVQDQELNVFIEKYYEPDEIKLII